MYTMNLGRGSKRKGVGESSGKKLYSMNLGRGSKSKGRGKVVGKVVSHESKTWFIEDRNGGK